jgi:hypothetical protein
LAKPCRSNILTLRGNWKQKVHADRRRRAGRNLCWRRLARWCCGLANGAASVGGEPVRAFLIAMVELNVLLRRVQHGAAAALDGGKCLPACLRVGCGDVRADPALGFLILYGLL